jgi:hypothetical protein
LGDGGIGTADSASQETRSARLATCASVPQIRFEVLRVHPGEELGGFHHVAPTKTAAIRLARLVAMSYWFDAAVAGGEARGKPRLAQPVVPVGGGAERHEDERSHQKPEPTASSGGGGRVSGLGVRGMRGCRLRRPTLLRVDR